MGVIANQVFLTIEDTIASRVKKVVHDKLDPSVRQAGALIEQGHYDPARDLINSWDISQELFTLDGFMNTKFIQSALFGASQVVDPEDSVLIDEPFRLDTLGNMITQFYAILNNGIVRLQSVAFKVIRAQEEGEVDIAVGDGIIKSWGGHVHTPAEIFKADLADLFGQAIDGNMNALVDVGASLTTSRVISYGALSEMSASGIQRYQVSEVLDERTCPACEIMDGQTFDVERALARSGEILQITDPDELKSRAPFPSQTKAGLEELDNLSEDDLAARGFDTPPYHPLCRGIVILVGGDAPNVDTEPVFVRPVRLRPPRLVRPPTPPVPPPVPVPTPVPMPTPFKVPLPTAPVKPAVPVAPKPIPKGPTVHSSVPKPPKGIMESTLESGQNPIDVQASARGMTREAYLAKRQANVEVWAKDTQVYSRTTETGYRGILKDGRFKSQAESGFSQGMFNPEARFNFEKNYFGMGKVAKNKNPIYGYTTQNKFGKRFAGTSRTGDGVGMYGSDIAFKFKKAVKRRTTFTGDDSLTNMRSAKDGKAVFGPSPLNKPDHRSMPFRRVDGSIAETAKDAALASDYIEVQIWDGVKLADVEKIIFYDKSVFDSLSHLAIEKGIKVELFLGG